MNRQRYLTPLVVVGFTVFSALLASLFYGLTPDGFGLFGVLGVGFGYSIAVAFIAIGVPRMIDPSITIELSSPTQGRSIARFTRKSATVAAVIGLMIFLGGAIGGFLGDKYRDADSEVRTSTAKIGPAVLVDPRLDRCLTTVWTHRLAVRCHAWYVMTADDTHVTATLDSTACHDAPVSACLQAVDVVRFPMDARQLATVRFVDPVRVDTTIELTGGIVAEPPAEAEAVP